MPQSDLKIYDGGPTKIIQCEGGWNAGPKGYFVLAVHQVRDDTLKAWMPVDTYVKSKDAKACAGQHWGFFIRQVSWATWLQLQFYGLINAIFV
ncbi:hypothetical protein DPV78_003431 [Talaromyces pinophilus]|nr:hypothetical protein DPV78_003431 [Talaromyces pinophilus]